MAITHTSTPDNPAMQPFPPWLDLPPGYIVNDWIQWQKGKLVAARLRERPELVEAARQRLEHHDRRFGCDEEWLEILRTSDVETIAQIMESGSQEGQRLRSASPFAGMRIVSREEIDAFYERAFFG